MNCTEKRCTSDTQVVDSREHITGIRRRRRCIKRGHRFTTYELSKDEFMRLTTIEKKWREVQKLLSNKVQ